MAVIEEAITSRKSEEVNAELVAIPTAIETRDALFTIHRDKALGPDGFSSYFFRTNWATVGPAMFEEIIEFFRDRVWPQNINLTHIRLILKITSPKVVADYRPIVLCSVYYKIISKILTWRLQPILDLIISENQSAFIPG